MAREHYRNGDPITLPGGRDFCNPLRINGVLCHEPGCPEAWCDHEVDCFECGCKLYPESLRQRTCPDCLNPPDDGNGMQPCAQCGEPGHLGYEGLCFICEDESDADTDA